MSLRLFLLVCMLAAAPLLTAADASAADPKRPNIVFILADDLGYGDLGCYGQTRIKTPNLDRMASEGLRFTQFYTGCPVCAPSRCTLMTGKHLGHAAIRDNMQRAPTPGQLGQEGQHAMPPETVTIAQLLKKAGYATGVVGKWGLGMPAEKSGPLQFGFDHHYGYLCQGMAHTFYPPYLWRDDKQEPLAGNPKYEYGQKQVIELSGQVYSSDLIAADALKWVREHKDQPFFLYYASTIPHLSLQVPEDSLAQYRGQWPETPVTDSKHYSNHPTPRAAYAAMISRLDADIGRLFALLKELQLDENTIVFFGSDNGAVFKLSGTDPEFFQSNGGLRGFKQQVWEGGIRTPFIARWPGKIKAGGTSPHVGAYWDVLPTLCELTGVAAPGEIDGLSIAPTLLSQPGQKEHDYLYWEYHGDGGRQAIRFGDWKGVREQVKKNKDALPELYNLATDPGEKTNLAAERPDLAAKAAELMKRARTPSAEPKWNF